MGKAENTRDPKTREEETSHNDLRRTVYELIANAWDMVYSLERSGGIEIKATPFDCYEDLYDGRAKAYYGFTTCKEFIDGYLEQWIFASPNPRKVEVEGSDIYCMLLAGKRIDGKQGMLRLVLPFRTISSIFADVQNQIAEA